jgi:thiosulfate/3-mercaptopyruvate sulfurtransferase
LIFFYGTWPRPCKNIENIEIAIACIESMTISSISTNADLNNDSALVSCEWLHQHLDRPDLIILDATYFLPRQQRSAREEYNRQHIQGTRFFDIDDIADRHSPLPHTLPSAEQFGRQVGQLGIDNGSWVIVYDHNHFFASARAWWMFRMFGHDKVKVLDGGLTRWKQLAFPLTDERKAPIYQAFQAMFRPELFADLAQIRKIQQQGSSQILDSRSEDSFNGQRPLHEPGLQPGHIPGSLNIPYQNLFLPDDHRLRPVDQLRQLLSSAAVDCSKPLVTSCGSGVSAALLVLALYQTGIPTVPLFDGSWAEWGRRKDVPIEPR